jgi:hypothetical protein
MMNNSNARLYGLVIPWLSVSPVIFFATYSACLLVNISPSTALLVGLGCALASIALILGILWFAITLKNRDEATGAAVWSFDADPDSIPRIVPYDILTSEAIKRIERRGWSEEEARQYLWMVRFDGKILFPVSQTAYAEIQRDQVDLMAFSGSSPW